MVAKGYQGVLNIAPTSKTTSVAVVSLMNTNIQRGQDFINKLMEMYNRNTNNDKNEVAEKTKEFINERIKIIDEEYKDLKDKFIDEITKYSKNIKNPNVTLFMIIELVGSTCYNSILNNEPLPINEFKPYLYDEIKKMIN